ncbi:hypothetical protein GCE9029_02609 [Grimontia celer]|uniref:Uncharacterized protein n=1 Tax=Grimontia celer TaxID=1796497 RepID=A0A128F3S9_9GAMM|nr:hypothetical protein [Grimontia celer]CZF81437.1 hypothetical protein GCE9029_02609 [Grimontia celer]
MNTKALIEVTVLPDNSLQLETLPKVQIGTDCHTVNASTSVEVNGTSFSLFSQQDPDTFIVCKTYDVETESYFKQEAVIPAKYPIAMLHSFYFGGQPWLLSYHPDSDYVQFYRFDGEAITIIPVTSIRVGKGFTTVQPLYYRNDVFFVAYNKETGDVVKMQIVAPAYSELYAQKVWSATWAQGWTRFSFFRLGAENFFIKTNENYHKVNIDHFMDSIELGSHPVLNEPASQEMLSLSDVQTFYDISQNPYFFTYEPNGKMTFNRFDGDCEGWQLALSSQQAADTSLRHTVQLKECTLILML